MAAQLSSGFPRLQTPTFFPPRTGRHLESKPAAPAPSFAVRGSPSSSPPGCRSVGWALSGWAHPCPFTPCVFPLSPLHGQRRAWAARNQGNVFSLVGGSELETPNPHNYNRPCLYL